MRRRRRESGEVARRVYLRRRLTAVVVGAVALAAIWGVVHATMPGWYARFWYPLKYEETIKTHAERTGTDADLVAAVIWRESDFDPQARSDKGAIGLMQLLPETAEWVAGQNPELGYEPARVAEPEVNIAFGTWYLSYLLDKYGDRRVALAAYNGGESNAADWAKHANDDGRPLELADIPFPETRAFVRAVEEAQGIYRRVYGPELGLD